MNGLDEFVIALFQQLYDNLLDRFDSRIGTFRMGLALTPIAAEATAHAVRGDFPIHAFADGIFGLGVVSFYTYRMMTLDDKLQVRGRLRPINARSLKFKSRWTTLRIFYLFFFSSSFVFHHSVGGLGMVAIVYARCIVVRPRLTREKRRRFTYQTT